MLIKKNKNLISNKITLTNIKKYLLKKNKNIYLELK